MLGALLYLIIMVLIIWLVVNIVQGALTVAGLGSPLLGILVVIVLILLLANR